MKRLLVLLPEPGASATVRHAQALGLDAIAVPLFKIEAIDWRAPGGSGFDGLLLTSANAIRAGGEQIEELRKLKVYAVGEATAKAAREAGFDIVASGDAGVDRLLSSIEPELKLLHLCGADRREPRDAKQAITAVAVYRATPIDNPDLSPATGSVALIHSPRAGTRLGELIADRSSISIAAISEAAADAAGIGWKSVEAAERPSEEALLALGARLCNKPDPE